LGSPPWSPRSISVRGMDWPPDRAAWTWRQVAADPGAPSGNANHGARAAVHAYEIAASAHPIYQDDLVSDAEIPLAGVDEFVSYGFSTRRSVRVVSALPTAGQGRRGRHHTGDEQCDSSSGSYGLDLNLHWNHSIQFNCLGTFLVCQSDLARPLSR